MNYSTIQLNINRYDFVHLRRSDDRYAIQLNELKPEMAEELPPTDCRFRPDERLYENGDVKGAGREKHRLEEKQRAAKKTREAAGDEWNPLWFELKHNDLTGDEEWTFNDRYWEVRKHRDYAQCPDIY